MLFKNILCLRFSCDSKKVCMKRKYIVQRYKNAYKETYQTNIQRNISNEHMYGNEDFVILQKDFVILKQHYVFVWIDLFDTKSGGVRQLKKFS